MTREDRFTTTEADAAAYERARAADDYDPERPTRLEAERDEADECQHLHQSDIAFADPIPSRAVWVCDDCGQVVDE